MIAYENLPYFVQGLIDPTTYNEPYYTWSDQGQAVALKFNFALAPLDGELNFQPYTLAQQASVRLALAKYSAVAGVSFQEVPASDTAQLTFFRDDLTSQGAGDAAGYTWSPSWYYPEAGDVHINSLEYTNSDTYAPGTYAFQVLIHEIGHGLGLKHTFEAPALPAAEDTQTNSVMTYNLEWWNAQNLGMFDIAAVQLLYGVNHAARAGNNVYTLGDRYIWDGAGIDTLDASAETARLHISLGEGSWVWEGLKSDSILAPGQAFIGYGTLLERVKGGILGDVLQGNVANNVIWGNGGADALWGFNGNDTIWGGAGNDRLYGGSGNDFMYGGLHNDLLLGQGGSDFLRGDGGNDTLVGGLGVDTLEGGAGADTFVFASLAEAGKGLNRDSIADFVSGLDKIDLSAIDAVLGNGLTNDAFHFIGTQGFSHSAGELRYGSVSGILAGDVNGDGVADFQIQLVGNPPLQLSDLILVA